MVNPERELPNAPYAHVKGCLPKAVVALVPIAMQVDESVPEPSSQPVPARIFNRSSNTGTDSTSFTLA